MEGFLVIFTILVILFSLFSITSFYTKVLFNGNPSDYYQPTRLLTEEELALLQHQYPKEHFEPHLYQINGYLTHRSITIRSGRSMGFYDYYQLNELKVYICYMGTAQLAKANSGSGNYQLVKGKRKNYLVDVNGCNFFHETKKWRDWFACWEQARNGRPTEEKNLRILGQRQPTRKESKILIKLFKFYEKPASYAIGMMLSFLLIFLLIVLNFSDSFYLWLLVPVIGLCLGISYCFWLHLRLFPTRLDKINIIEGQLRREPKTNSIYIGNLRCHISSPALLDKFETFQLNGKIRAVEVTHLGYFYEIVNIEGVGNINDYWQKYIPSSNYAHYLVTSIACLILAGSLYGIRLQNYPYQDIWPWTGFNFSQDYIVTSSDQLDHFANQSLLIQLKGEFEPYLESNEQTIPKLYWNSDPRPLLLPLIQPEDEQYLYGNILFIAQFKMQQKLIAGHDFHPLVKTPRYYQLIKPYETYYQELFAVQNKRGAVIAIYGDKPSMPTYQLSENAVTILNHISQRDNRKPLVLNGELNSYSYLHSGGTHQKVYHLSHYPNKLLMIKINAFNLLLLLLYSIPALLFGAGCIVINKFYDH